LPTPTCTSPRLASHGRSCCALEPLAPLPLASSTDSEVDADSALPLPLLPRTAAPQEGCSPEKSALLSDESEDREEASANCAVSTVPSATIHDVYLSRPLATRRRPASCTCAAMCGVGYVCVCM
jgi:hypothetical protein